MGHIGSSEFFLCRKEFVFNIKAWVSSFNSDELHTATPKWVHAECRQFFVDEETFEAMAVQKRRIPDGCD